VSSGGRSAPEPAVDAAFDRLVEEGDERLSRPLLPLVGTGLLGGIDVGTGVLAYFVVQHYTHNPLLAGIAFSIGFVALLLARSELFTENFLVPVVNVAAGHRNIWALLRLWSITLVANLLGGWAIAWLIVTGRPDLKETAVLVSDHYFELGINLHSFVLAVLAGTVMTLMTRMQHASDNLGVQLVPACFRCPAGRWAAVSLGARLAVHIRRPALRFMLRLSGLAWRAGLVGPGQPRRRGGPGDGHPAGPHPPPGAAGTCRSEELSGRGAL